MRYLAKFVIFLLFFSCGTNKPSGENTHSGKHMVVAVNYPLYYFAQRIAGNHIQLEYPVPPNVDPAYWIPGDSALIIFQSADIILANGADYSKWMNNVSLPASRVFNTSKQAEEQYISLEEVSTHSHGPDGEHEHSGYAFTTWLDFQVAAEQAAAVKDILQKKMPEHQNDFEKNYEALRSELFSLHESMKDVSLKIDNQIIFTSHPVYQYLSRAYNINIQSVHFEPNELPSDEQWEEFDLLLKKYPSNIMLWEALPLAEVIEVLKEKGIAIVVFNPSGNKPENGDFIGIMNENIKSLERILTQKG